MADEYHANIPIGQFSQLTFLSVRMLRYYDEHDVLVPAHTDPQTGYRYYSLSQLREAGRIRALRDLGFGVAAIAGLLHADPQTLQRALSLKRQELEADAQQAAKRIRGVDVLLTTVEEHPMTIDITRTTHPAQTAVTLRRIISSYDHEGELWQEMMASLPPSVFPLIAGPGIAIFHDEDYKEADVDVEVVLPVRAPVEVPEPLRCVELPARNVVVATFNGPYDQMPEATSAAAAWMGAHELRMTGDMYNRYLVAPGQSVDPESWVTEVCIVVADD